jgi:hypothetical protein
METVTIITLIIVLAVAAASKYALYKARSVERRLDAKERAEEKAKKQQEDKEILLRLQNEKHYKLKFVTCDGSVLFSSVVQAGFNADYYSIQSSWINANNLQSQILIGNAPAICENGTQLNKDNIVSIQIVEINTPESK